MLCAHVICLTRCQTAGPQDEHLENEKTIGRIKKGDQRNNNQKTKQKFKAILTWFTRFVRGRSSSFFPKCDRAGNSFCIIWQRKKNKFRLFFFFFLFARPRRERVRRVSCEMLKLFVSLCCCVFTRKHNIILTIYNKKITNKQPERPRRPGRRMSGWIW